MRGRSAVVAAWAIRVVRELWPDHNPLRRTIDRAEAVVVAGLAAAFLAGFRWPRWPPGTMPTVMPPAPLPRSGPPGIRCLPGC